LKLKTYKTQFHQKIFMKQTNSDANFLKNQRIAFTAIGGSIGGIVSKLLTHPLDTVKAKLFVRFPHLIPKVQ